MKYSIGINLTWLVPGHVGGSEEHLLSLLRSFSDVAGDDFNVRVYGQPSLVEAHPDLQHRFQCLSSPVVKPNKGMRIAAENSWLAYASRNDHVLHHGGGVVPALRSAVALVTIHDLQPVDLPMNFSTAKRRWLQWMIPRSIKVSRFVLCPSAFTSSRMQSLYGTSADKIQVLPSVQLTEVPTSAQDAARIKTRFGRYLLYPAIAYTHKRHLDVVQAVAQLEPEFDDVSVVFTGREGPLTQQIQHEASRLGVAARVHQLGRVPRQELVALYRNAQALVFPSAYEGFGNPLIEAMSYGCPVITSNAGSLEEVAGGSALVFEVGDVAEITAKVRQVLTTSLGESLRRSGKVRAQFYRSQTPGVTLAELYHRAAGRYRR